MLSNSIDNKCIAHIPGLQGSALAGYVAPDHEAEAGALAGRDRQLCPALLFVAAKDFSFLITFKEVTLANRNQG